MIIDEILDRRDEDESGVKAEWTEESLRYVYDEAMEFHFDYLSRAIDGGTEADIRQALCRYIDENGYSPEIKEYVNSVRWLPKGIM